MNGVTQRTIRRDGKRAEFMERLEAVAPAQAQAVHGRGRRRTGGDQRLPPGTRSCRRAADGDGQARRRASGGGRRAAGGTEADLRRATGTRPSAGGAARLAPDASARCLRALLPSAAPFPPGWYRCRRPNGRPTDAHSASAGQAGTAAGDRLGRSSMVPAIVGDHALERFAHPGNWSWARRRCFHGPCGATNSMKTRIFYLRLRRRDSSVLGAKRRVK